MFVLAILDTDAQKNEMSALLKMNGVQVNFAKSDEDIGTLCHDMDPDALLLKAHYDDVGARFLLRHLKDSDILPEKIAVLSDPKDAGTEFTIRPGSHALWITLTQLLSWLSGNTLPAEEDTPPIPKRILHITDDRLLLKIVGDLIRANTSYLVESASNGLEGLKIHEEFKPDLILTDWDLPDIDGIELCKKIKIEQGDQHVQVALFSSMTDEHLIEEAYKAKAKAYIVKPVKPDILLHKIERMLESAH